MVAKLEIDSLIITLSIKQRLPNRGLLRAMDRDRVLNDPSSFAPIMVIATGDCEIRGYNQENAGLSGAMRPKD